MFVQLKTIGYLCGMKITTEAMGIGGMRELSLSKYDKRKAGEKLANHKTTTAHRRVLGLVVS